jgi:hypothetical protein
MTIRLTSWVMACLISVLGPACAESNATNGTNHRDGDPTACADGITYTVTARDDWPVEIRVDGTAGDPVEDSPHALVQWVYNVESPEEAYETVLHLCSHDRETGEVIECTEHLLDYAMRYEHWDVEHDAARVQIDHFHEDGTLMENRIDGPCYFYSLCGEPGGAAC